MSDQIFFDTNIVIYLYSDTEIEKSNVVERLLNQRNHHVISTQVINEFAYVMHRKRKISYESIAKSVIELTASFDITKINLSTINYAFQIASTYKYAYFDSLMIASAIENNCNVLYSEDLHHGHVIEKKIEIRNPFEPLNNR